MILTLVIAGVGTSAAVAQSTAEQLREVNRQLKALQRDLQEQEKDIEDFQGDVESDVDVLWILVLALLGGGFVIGLSTTIRSDQRNTELHRLSFAGESAAQDRAEQVHTTFLDSSQRTLGLVNETLQLAKDASRRADEALELRAQRAQDQVEEEARELVGPLVGRPELHSIVTDQGRRRRIVELAHEISGVYGYLEMHGSRLSAECQFVLGLNAHFQGESTRAIKHLKIASTDKRSQGEDVEIAALYWTAYEQNNIGDYSEAKDHFRQASELAAPQTARRYEIQRMLYETMFFEIAHRLRHADERHTEDEVQGLLTELATVKEKIPKDSDGHRARAHLDQTEAHLHVWAAGRSGLSWSGTAEQRKSLEVAFGLFKEAVDLEKGALELWTVLGLAETGFHLSRPGFVFGTDKEADRKTAVDLYGRAIDLASAALETRVEHRTLVANAEAKLIAQVRLGVAPERVELTRERLIENWKRLEPHMHVFSHFQKCNLPSEDFKTELDEFWEDYERAGGRGS